MLFVISRFEILSSIKDSKSTTIVYQKFVIVYTIGEK